MVLPIAVISLILFVQFNTCHSSFSNEYEHAKGCKQFNSNTGYFVAHPYFDTSTFKNIKTDDKGVTRMRIGALGERHAAIRFSSVSTNSDTPMTEIALAHSRNTRTYIYKFSRTFPKALSQNTLGDFPISGVMSFFKPAMLTVEIHPGGLVTVTKDGDMAPLFQFNDPTFSHKYIGFCKFDVPVAFFYDCPLLPAADASTKALLPDDGATKCARVNKISVNTCLKIVDCSDCSTRDDCFSRIPRIGQTFNENENNEEIQCF